METLLSDFSDRQFAFEGHAVHYVEGGSGPAVLLLHGSGPGASTRGNWASVLPMLGERFHVFGMDLIGFGRSDRKTALPFFDVELWLRQIARMIELIGEPDIGVIAHSLSGALALKTAAHRAGVTHVLTTGSAGGPFAVSDNTRDGWTFPQSRADLVRVAQSLVYDKSLITDAFIATRESVLRQPGYADYIGKLFSGDKQAIIDSLVIPDDELRTISAKVTLLHGKDDLSVPASVALHMGSLIPRADTILIGRCAHSVALEKPDIFIAAVDYLFRDLARS